MKQNYKYQWLYIMISLIGLLFTGYFYLQNKNLKNEAQLKKYKIIEQGCRSYKGGSSVKINFNHKKYIIRLANKECLKYPIGSEVYLYYNKKHDYFYKPDNSERDRFRILIFLILLIISLIPWNNVAFYLKDSR